MCLQLFSRLTKWLPAILIFCGWPDANAQTGIDLSGFNKKGKARVVNQGNLVSVSWPASETEQARIVIDQREGFPLIDALQLIRGKKIINITQQVDPSFILTIGKRDLVSQNGWNIFFDKVPLKPFTVHPVLIKKGSIAVRSAGSRTIIKIGSLSAAHFSGDLEITLYNGSALLNIAAVLSTGIDSTAIVYDAGLTAAVNPWDSLAWMNVNDRPERKQVGDSDSAMTHRVKYRTIIGETKSGSLAIFPAPHQYFYPLDEAFNLNFTWSGKNYRNVLSNYGIGIRQDLYGDKRFVPWFNAPPGTKQRLNFFCLLSSEQGDAVFGEVKKFTNGDVYPKLDNFKKFSSHFHNEFVMSVILAGKKVPDTPSFVKVFKAMGVDIVHLGEFHYTAHPKGPDEQRLKELNELFNMCARYSDDRFLLLPGEEPNEFFGGHWLQFFPKPVYWIMSRAKDVPFISKHPDYGKVYRVSDKEEMLKLLELENGLAWTAHPRTKGSTGYPDKYRSEPFFNSPNFMGAAWKPIPADLSLDRLGVRVLDLIDDMNNWGLQKKIIAEADIFSIEPANEMYAHMNVNYLQLNELPAYSKGWSPVIDVLNHGRFFSTTGEVLIPSFSIGKAFSGDTLRLREGRSEKISFRLKWTFPLEFAMIVSGDGENIYKEKISLNSTEAFGDKVFNHTMNLQGRKWVRLEAWDAAVNGAFTQTIWLQ
ncbi:CehA/McbA family metallohydrolase domain-containing protein [Flavitalea sp.]|nr:hypothetical protein [Flavitalea sp.]